MHEDFAKNESAYPEVRSSTRLWVGDPSSAHVRLAAALPAASLGPAPTVRSFQVKASDFLGRKTGEQLAC